ncbi:MAG TPA: hypothetical protein VLK23_15420 [Thermodesulfobacteriota bacterium]|nr:hypothetical protein [Thermodesulfobacteriota bacterium]
MKKNMIAFVALLTMVTFAGVAMAQTPVKPTAPAVTDKPSVSTAEKPKTEGPKVEKKETSKAIRVSGTVAAYESGKMIKVKGKDQEMAFDLTGDTRVKGEIRDGAKVTVMYKKEGDKRVATTISVVAEKKGGEKKPTPAPAEKKS